MRSLPNVAPIISAWMSVCRTVRASSAPGAKLERGTLKAPIRARASQVTTHAVPFAKSSPTRVPFPTPLASSRPANSALLDSASAKVNRKSTPIRKGSAPFPRRRRKAAGTEAGRSSSSEGRPSRRCGSVMDVWTSWMRPSYGTSSGTLEYPATFDMFTICNLSIHDDHHVGVHGLLLEQRLEGHAVRARKADRVAMGSHNVGVARQTRRSRISR